MTISIGLNRLEHTEWPSDGRLQHEVRQQLQLVLGVDPDKIGVFVHSGVVYLDGEIPHATEDADVRRAVFRVHGVVGMIDRLRPAPPEKAPLDH
jgi:osmotically-inducible protein OsmY